MEESERKNCLMSCQGCNMEVKRCARCGFDVAEHARRLRRGLVYDTVRHLWYMPATPKPRPNEL